jgi:hypothetical protein
MYECGFPSRVLRTLSEYDDEYGMDKIKHKWIEDEKHVFTGKWGKEFIPTVETEIERWTRDVERFGGHEVHFLETDEEKMTVLGQRLNEQRTAIDNLLKGKWSYLDFELMRVPMRKTEKLMNKIRARMLHKDQPNSGRLNEHDIVKAREVNLDQIVERGRIPCPFHNGKDKNFAIKGRYGCCYVCGEWADAIKWLIEIEGMKFVDAVRYLNRR